MPRICLLTFLVVSCIASWLPAQEPAAQPAASTPAVAADKADAEEEPTAATEVAVGIYVNRVQSISLKDNQFAIDFHIWFRWQGDTQKPIEQFDIANGKIESKDKIFVSKLGDTNYAACRVIATITKYWDVSKFPLDDHRLTIEIEDNDNEEGKLRYVLDEKNCAIDPQVRVPGWNIAGGHGAITSHKYQTNYGDTSLPTGSESVYSRFTYSIDIVRPGYGHFWKLFFGLFVAVAIACLCFFIKPTDLDPRFGLGVGAIFAAVASEYVIISSLPDSNLMTLADKLHMLAFALIFFVIAQSTLSLKLYTSGGEGTSRFLDRVSLILVTLVYSIGSYLVVAGVL